MLEPSNVTNPPTGAILAHSKTAGPAADIFTVSDLCQELALADRARDAHDNAELEAIEPAVKDANWQALTFHVKHYVALEDLVCAIPAQTPTEVLLQILHAADLAGCALVNDLSKKEMRKEFKRLERMLTSAIPAAASAAGVDMAAFDFDLSIPGGKVVQFIDRIGPSAAPIN